MAPFKVDLEPQQLQNGTTGLPASSDKGFFPIPTFNICTNKCGGNIMMANRMNIHSLGCLSNTLYMFNVEARSFKGGSRASNIA